MVNDRHRPAVDYTISIGLKLQISVLTASFAVEHSPLNPEVNAPSPPCANTANGGNPSILSAAHPVRPGDGRSS